MIQIVQKCVDVLGLRQMREGVRKLKDWTRWGDVKYGMNVESLMRMRE